MTLLSAVTVVPGSSSWASAHPEMMKRFSGAGLRARRQADQWCAVRTLQRAGRARRIPATTGRPMKTATASSPFQDNRTTAKFKIIVIIVEK